MKGMTDVKMEMAGSFVLVVAKADKVGLSTHILKVLVNASSQCLDELRTVGIMLHWASEISV